MKVSWRNSIILENNLWDREKYNLKSNEIMFLPFHVFFNNHVLRVPHRDSICSFIIKT